MGALTIDMKVCSLRTEIGGALAVWAEEAGSGLAFSGWRGTGQGREGHVSRNQPSPH